MKRKIFTLCMVVALIAVAAVGSTLAYFQDTDYADNVLVAGNVDIELHEDNALAEDNADYAIDDDYRTWLLEQKFHPGVTVEKDGWVENVGSNEAYVRMFVAYPTKSIELMTVNFNADISTEWTEGTSYSFTDADGVEYTVQVFVLNDPLQPEAKTVDTITSVTMLTSTEAVKNADNKIVYYQSGEDVSTGYVSADGTIPVLLHAQAVQTTTFANADAAFTAAFGAAEQNWWN